MFDGAFTHTKQKIHLVLQIMKILGLKKVKNKNPRLSPIYNVHPKL